MKNFPLLPFKTEGGAGKAKVDVWIFLFCFSIERNAFLIKIFDDILIYISPLIAV